MVKSLIEDSIAENAQEAIPYTESPGKTPTRPPSETNEGLAPGREKSLLGVSAVFSDYFWIVRNVILHLGNLSLSHH